VSNVNPLYSVIFAVMTLLENPEFSARQQKAASCGKWWDQSWSCQCNL